MRSGRVSRITISAATKNTISKTTVLVASLIATVFVFVAIEFVVTVPLGDLKLSRLNEGPV